MNYTTTTSLIASMSSRIAQGPSGLLSGPQTINCTKPEQSTCVNVTESVIEQVHAMPTDKDNTLVLTGEHRVYNLFKIEMKVSV